jgi:hypothetical protein
MVRSKSNVKYYAKQIKHIIMRKDVVYLGMIWCNDIMSLNTSDEGYNNGKKCGKKVQYVGLTVSCMVSMRNLKSSKVRTVCILVMVAFDFFWEEGFRGKPLLFFRGSTSSPCFCSTSFSSKSSPSPPFFGDMKEVFTDVLSNSWTSSVFFVLLGSGVSCVVSRLSVSDISLGFAGMRRFTDQSFLISSKSSSVIL